MQDKRLDYRPVQLDIAQHLGNLPVLYTLNLAAQSLQRVSFTKTIISANNGYLFVSGRLILPPCFGHTCIVTQKLSKVCVYFAIIETVPSDQLYIKYIKLFEEKSIECIYTHKDQIIMIIAIITVNSGFLDLHVLSNSKDILNSQQDTIHGPMFPVINSDNYWR